VSGLLATHFFWRRALSAVIDLTVSHVQCQQRPAVTIQKHQRLYATVAAHVVASAALALLYPVIGQTAGVFGLVSVVAGAICFGLRGGLVASVVQAVLNNLVMQFIIFPPVGLSGSSALGIAFMFAVGAAVGNQRDLSRRLREELMLNQRLRVRERETLAAIPDAMIRIEADGVCCLQGAEAQGQLGQVLEQALGRSLSTHLHREVSEQVKGAQTSGTARVFTLDLPGAVTYDARYLPAADASVLMVMRDVTEQRKLLRRLTSAENLASLGTMAAGLGHEINNPLTYVITSLSNMEQALSGAGESVTTELRTALDGCWRIRDLVRNILDTSNSKKQEIDSVFVPEIIDTALVLVQPQVRHRATVIWNQQDVPCALAHRTKLLQVVVNLVVNASQAFLDNRASVNQILVRAYGDGEYVVIEVEDNGPGMDEVTKQRAVEPFFTTKEPGQGTGLGLFLCSSIIESLEGRLDIESEVGHGTKVIVRLPVADESPTSRIVIRRSSISVTDEVDTNSRILIVDDEPQIRRAMQRLLGKERTISLCANGAEALKRIVAGERFDVILCDILMPEMTGIELFDELKLHYPEQACRMVFISGGATSESVRAFLVKHRARVLAKPFQPAEFESAVLNLATVPFHSQAPSMAPR